jgi:hypothetical protein
VEQVKVLHCKWELSTSGKYKNARANFFRKQLQASAGLLHIQPADARSKPSSHEGVQTGEQVSCLVPSFLCSYTACVTPCHAMREEPRYRRLKQSAVGPGGGGGGAAQRRPASLDADADWAGL